MEILLNLLKFACLVPLHVPTIYSSWLMCHERTRSKLVIQVIHRAFRVGFDMSDQGVGMDENCFLNQYIQFPNPTH